MLSVLVIAAYANPDGVGESYSGAKWIESLSRQCQITVLTCDGNAAELQKRNPGVHVVSWKLPESLQRMGRFNSMLKPGYWIFYREATKWIRQSSHGQFDIVHQVTPIALRYPSPGVALKNAAFVLGPLAGSLPTPKELKTVTRDPVWVRARALDSIRMKLDPLLKHTYRNADLILGAADYVERFLPKNRLGLFKVIPEAGIDEVNERVIDQHPSIVKFLFVGRLVSTKGAHLLIEAAKKIEHAFPFRVDILGDGPERAQLVARTRELGLESIVKFHGRVSRETVESFYSKADVFTFPSYREPSGNVVFEAMSWKLPVIAADYGGPGCNVSEECGIKIPISRPDPFADSLAVAMKTVGLDDELRLRLAAGEEKGKT